MLQDRISRLLSTREPGERDGLAIELADAAAAEAIPALRDLLRRPDTKGARATLLNALSLFPTGTLDAETLRTVAAIAADEGETGEARGEAMGILEAVGAA